MAEQFDYNRASMLIRKYNIGSFEDIAKLPIPKADKDLMHSQLKVDDVYALTYADYKNNPDVAKFDLNDLIKKFGPHSDMNKVKSMLEIDDMNQGLLP